MTNYSCNPEYFNCCLSSPLHSFGARSTRWGPPSEKDGGPQATILLGGVLYPKTGCGGGDEVVVVVLQLYYMV